MQIFLPQHTMLHYKTVACDKPHFVRTHFQHLGQEYRIHIEHWCSSPLKLWHFGLLRSIDWKDVQLFMVLCYEMPLRIASSSKSDWTCLSNGLILSAHASLLAHFLSSMWKCKIRVFQKHVCIEKEDAPYKSYVTLHLNKI